MDGLILLPSGRNEENLRIFDITTNEFVKFFVLLQILLIFRLGYFPIDNLFLLS